MALFSQWDWSRNAFKVFATPQRVSIGDDPSPPHPSGIHFLGAVPDVEAKPLPRGATFMGYSHVPRGEIVRSDGKASTANTYGLSGNGDDTIQLVSLVTVGFVGLIGYWLFVEAQDWVKKRRRTA